MQDQNLTSRQNVRRTASIGLVIAGILGLLAFMAVQGAGGIPSNRELDWLNQLARSGDAGAQLQLGLAYREGRYGLTPNLQISKHWLTEAAQNGNAYAADQVANMLAHNQQDEKQAVQWWHRGAQGGNVDAEVKLAEFDMQNGNDKKAVKWLRVAANDGDPRAHKDLLSLYKVENLPEADLLRGENPVEVLGERVHSTSMKTLFAAWQILRESSTSLQSAALLKARAKEGDPVAEYQLGERYETGAWDVNRDLQQARRWLKQSAAAGNRIAIKTLRDEQQHKTEHNMSASGHDKASRT
jgi:TPR repeat protein